MAADPILDCVIALVIDKKFRDDFDSADEGGRRRLLAGRNPALGRMPVEIVDAFVKGNSRGISQFFAANGSTQTGGRKKAGIRKKVVKLVMEDE